MRSSRLVLSDKTNFPGLCIGGRRNKPMGGVSAADAAAAVPPPSYLAVGCSVAEPPSSSPTAAAPCSVSQCQTATPPDARRRRGMELGLTPELRASAAASDSFTANQSWAGTGRRSSPVAPRPPAEPMPWETPPMRRPRADQTLLKGDNLFSFSYNGATARSPYRYQQRASDAAGRSLNDSWAFYKSFAPPDSLTAQTLFITPTKSVFTIDSRTSQILMWNDMATDLLGYSGPELSGMRLKQLFVSSESRPRMEEAHLSSQGGVVVFAGNVVEVSTKSGEVVPMSLWLRKIETGSTERRCVAVLEPVQRKTVEVTCDRFGRICDVSGCVGDLFNQQADEFIGLKASQFIPALQLPDDLTDIPRGLRVQEVTAKRSDGSSFPVSVRLSLRPGSPTPSPFLSLHLHAYTSLMGLVVMDEQLRICNYNRNFISLTFGYEKDALVDKNIRDLIPTFDEDMDMLESDDDSLSLPPIDDDDLALPAAVAPPAAGGDTTDAASVAFSALSLKRSSASPPPCSQRSPVESTHAQSRSGTLCLSDDETSARGPVECGEPGHTRPLVTSTPGHPRPAAGRRHSTLRDNTYYGLARHRDGSEFNITYDLCTVALDDDSIVYCLWIGQDRPEVGPSSLLGGDTSAAAGHLSLGQVIQQRAAVAAGSSGGGCTESEDAEHCWGEYSRYYTTIQQIGRGAFGFVKLGYRNGDRLLVVTKFIRKEKVHADHWVEDPTLRRRVPLEVSLLSMLHHPHIIRVLDVYENSEYLQLVMERHGCMDLFEFIDRDPALDEALASYIFRQICSALSHLHALEILHRDVKDENVIIDASFHVKLIDFGSATFVARDQLLSTFCGTVEYCAPEVLLGNKYDGYMLETWSLGVTLFTLLCGENPFHDVEDTISKPLRLPSNITPALAQLLAGLLEKSPRCRLRLPQVSEHPWTLQPICIDSYKFEEVVACSGAEVNPPRFLAPVEQELDLSGLGPTTHATPPTSGRRRDLAAQHRPERHRVRSDETQLCSLPCGDSAPLHQSLHQ